MFQVRIHGRGGQGVVTAAEMLSLAAFSEGHHSQAFPSFGSERTGAPVVAYCRIDDKEIRIREPITEPDALLIQDPTLLHQVDLFSGLARGGYILINSTRSLSELGIDELARGIGRFRMCAVPATEIAMKHVGRPLPNAALLGGFAAISGEVKLKSVVSAIRQKFPRAIADQNIAAASEAYALVQKGEEVTDA